MVKQYFFLLAVLIVPACQAMRANKHQLAASRLRDLVTQRTYNKSDIQHVEEILNEGISVNHTFSGGFTPLYYAANRCSELMCECLVKNGANPHIENCDGKTPLDIARESWMKPELKLSLIKSGCISGNQIPSPLSGFMPSRTPLPLLIT